MCILWVGWGEGAVAQGSSSPLPPLDQLDLPNKKEQERLTGSIVFIGKQFTGKGVVIRSADEQFCHHFKLDTLHSPPPPFVRKERKTCNV